MKKFKVKNRQKRKYTRHAAVPQSTFSMRTLFASLLPLIILAIAFATMLLMNLNLREQTSSIEPLLQTPTIQTPTFRLPEIPFPTITLPGLSLPTISAPSIEAPAVSPPTITPPEFSADDIFSQPFVALGSFLSVVFFVVQTTFIMVGKAFVAFFVIPDTRAFWSIIGNIIVTFFSSLGAAGNLTISGLARVGDLLVQSINLVGLNFMAGAQTVTAASAEYAVRAATILASSAIFIFEKVVWIVTLLFSGIVFVVLFIFHALGAFAEGVARIVMIPFQVLGAFWLKIKPYVDILGVHVGMVGTDMQNGVESFNDLGNALK